MSYKPVLTDGFVTNISVIANHVQVSSLSQYYRGLYGLYYYYHIYPTPPLGQDMTQGQFFKRIFTGLNSEFSFS